jgi:1-hydroxycarotenoid 3,4-desaturase
MKTKRIVVVGAGVGGLTAALLLAARGFDVTVLERAGGPGGKMRQVFDGGHAIDAGPTVFTLKHIFQEIFASAGLDFDDCVPTVKADVLARHAWSAHERLDLFTDIDKSADAIGMFAGARDAQGFRDFCAESARVWRTVEQPVVRAERARLFSLIAGAGLRGLPDLLATSPFESLWHALGRHFHDPRLRQLFGRYATYTGSSPFLAPATLMLIAHVEQDGVWMIQGGMHRLAQTFADKAAEKGATFRYDSHVSSIEMADGGSRVTLASGERFAADAVVFNGDANALAQGFLGENVRHAAPQLGPRERSLSAVTWTFAARTSGFPLVRHNVFFSPDYASEFDALSNGSLAYDPTVYVCAQDRGDDDAPRSDAGKLLVLVNAPAIGDTTLSMEEVAACASKTFARLERCGLTLLDSPAPDKMTTPRDFARLFPATGGALYGRPTHGWRATFQRPGVRSPIPHLYLTGGSVHPGAGVPMAAMSGLLAAACAVRDLTSR